jgi:hypothetical protein
MSDSFLRPRGYLYCTTGRKEENGEAASSVMKATVGGHTREPRAREPYLNNEDGLCVKTAFTYRPLFLAVYFFRSRLVRTLAHPKISSALFIGHGKRE